MSGARQPGARAHFLGKSTSATFFDERAKALVVSMTAMLGMIVGLGKTTCKNGMIDCVW